MMKLLLVIAALNYLRRLSQFVDSSELSITVAAICEYRYMKILKEFLTSSSFVYGRGF